MEKVRYTTETIRPDGEPEIKTDTTEDTGIETKDKLTPELLEFKKEWEESMFNDRKILERIQNALEATEKGEKESQDILDDVTDIVGILSGKSHLVEKSIRQNSFEDIRETGLQLVTDLGKLAEKIKYTDLSNFLSTIAINNAEPALEVLENNLPGTKSARLFLLESLKLGSEADRAKLIPVLKKYLSAVIDKKEFDTKDIEIMDRICLLDPSAEGPYRQTMAEHFEANPHDDVTILACINCENKAIKQAGIEQISKMLEKYDFGDQMETIIKKWQVGGGSPDYMPEAFKMNIEAINSIEEKRPGITKLLIAKFGIYNFGRYPEDLLIRQYDEYEDQSLPYGIAVFAEDDHNGAEFENKEELQELGDQLVGKYALRIAESDGKMDLLRLLTRLRLKYGNNHKISFVIVGGHGNKDLITLGNVNNLMDREIFIQDIAEYSGRKYQLLEKDATIILLSCDAGKSKGVGSKISKVMDTTVIAPGGHTGLNSIEPIFNKTGGLSFKVEYNASKIRATRFTPRKKKEPSPE